MINKHSRLRMRRRIRSRKRQVVDISETANKQLDRHVFRRWHNLYDARRFMVMWILLISILIVGTVMQTRALGRYYLEPAPVAGGVYTEGIVGSFSNANPIYAVNAVDSSVSRLIFSGLLTYNDQNQLVGDLAASWAFDAKANVYTVRLKPNLQWHDGKPLTADDVIFTFNTIKNPDAKSPLQVSWANIKIEKVSNTVVRFTLPNSYSPFLHSLTTGIVPEHLLKDIPAAQLRSAVFNNKQPVGAGPFKWKGIDTTSDSGAEIEKQRIQLVRFENFRGAPANLDGVTITTFPDALTLRDAFDDKKIMGASGLNFDESKSKEASQVQDTFPQTASTMIFMKNSNQILTDANVRRALVSGTNVANMVNALGYPAIPVKSPILKNQVGYNPAIVQRPYDKQEAIKLLEAAGWVIPAGKTIREKNGVPLSFGLVSESNPEYVRLTSLLQKQWEELGVGLNISLQPAETIAQSFILAHNYDILLYGINIGADPDTYPYWHSSQADVKSQGRLNLSEYKSGIADTALEAGRARVAPELRAAKYKPFLEAWRNDAPAIGLYQPNSFVITNQKIFGAEPKTINTPADRFNDIHTWMINTERTIKQ
jgi:peptide/nickel transport system substrate-binding protein